MDRNKIKIKTCAVCPTQVYLGETFCCKEHKQAQNDMYSGETFIEYTERIAERRRQRDAKRGIIKTP